MPPPRWKDLCRVPRRRAAAAAALLTYLAAAFGFPLPAAPARKDATIPFPCQDHPCGCQTAEQCWSGCCCFTPAERWAWAEAHHVRPPAYAERPAGGWRQAPLRGQAGREDDSGSRRCCQDRGEGAAQRQGTVTCHSCCGGDPSPADCCRP